MKKLKWYFALSLLTGGTAFAECETLPPFWCNDGTQVDSLMDAVMHNQFQDAATLALMPLKFLSFRGPLSSLAIITAIIRIPVAIAGWLIRRLGVKNSETIESAYAEILARA